MNIQSRLKKMENRITGIASKICQCQKEVVFKVEPFSESQKLRQPVFCQRCGKPEQQLDFTFNFNNETEVILPKLEDEPQ